MIKVLKTAVSYIVMLGILFLYMLFLDGDSGVIMLSFFIALPLISLILTLIAKKGISAEIICSEDTMKKNTDIKYSLKITKKSFFPAPFISVVTAVSPHFKDNDENTVTVSMPIKKEISVDRNIYTQFCGNGFISIENASISDYLNIFTFKLKNISSVHSINIVPQIHELNSAGTAFRAVSDTMRIDENEEETETSSLFGMASFPGYEHREYIAGDPLKRINWKLSSKKNNLMVRLDESIPSVRPSVILDLSQCHDDTEENIIMRERIIEGCLSFTDFCIRQGIECNFSYFENDKWNTAEIVSSADIENIALKASAFPDYSGISHLPDEAFAKSKSAGIFITFIQKYCHELEENISGAVQSGSSVFTVVAEKTSPADNLWYIDSEFEIKEFNKG